MSQRRKISRSTANTSTRPEKRRRWYPVLRRLHREGGTRLPRQGGQEVGEAVLHQRQFHEGTPAEHAAPGLSTQIPVEEQVRRLGGGDRCAYRPDHGQAARAWPRQEHVGVLDHRQRGLAGRIPGCWVHAVPRYQRHGARRWQPRSAIAVWPGKIKAGTKNYDIVGGLDLHGDLCCARRRRRSRRRIAKESR